MQGRGRLRCPPLMLWSSQRNLVDTQQDMLVQRRILRILPSAAGRCCYNKARHLNLPRRDRCGIIRLVSIIVTGRKWLHAAEPKL
jgi:hypothetical protein